MKKRILASAMAMIITLLAGCSNSNPGSENPGTSDSSTTSQKTESKVTSSSGNESSSAPESSTDNTSTASNPSESNVGVTQTAMSSIKLTNDNIVNSARLFDAMSKDKDNSMFSPLSLNMVLGMLESGAGGSTAQAIQQYLQKDNYADFAANYMTHVRDDLNREEGWLFDKYKDVFEIANSLWAGKAFPISADYKKSVSDKFGAEIQNVDFGNAKKAASSINNWTNDKTHKMIPEIVKEGQLGADTAAVLVNTVYFESGWVDEWYINEDKKQPFTLFDGSTKDIAMMSNGGDVYYENDKATAFGCYYKNGMQFIGILPKESGEFSLEGLDIPSLLVSANSKDYDVAAKMPRLNFESDFPLAETLKAAGLDVMFDPNSADFTKMQGIDGDDVRLFYVSDILQKTKLELDEYGTKAAAVTAAIVAGNAMPEPKEIRKVTLDRPFAFLIYDEEQGQIAFMGKVTNP